MGPLGPHPHFSVLCVVGFLPIIAQRIQYALLWVVGRAPDWVDRNCTFVEEGDMLLAGVQGERGDRQTGYYDLVEIA